MTERYQLAQVNVARAKAPMDHAVMKGFVDQLDAINALAERSPGFVWRLKDDAGDATSIRVFEDELIIVNMSVWESLEALKAFVYSGDHLTVLRNRKEWFEKMDTPILALWWIPAGTMPTTDDAKAALVRLEELGPTEAAFTFAKPFPPPLPELTVVQ
jgi:hypothetical protein